MTVRTKTVYRCTECGTDYLKWGGRCDACGEWNTLVEEVETVPTRSRASGRPRSEATATRPVPISDVEAARSTRFSSGLRELDYVLGGGIVGGSVVLIGGEPGIGKSTLLLQVAATCAAGGTRPVYVSPEA